EAYKLVLSQLSPEIAKVPSALSSMGTSISTLSKTMGGDVAGATEVLTTAMNQFQVSTDDPIAAASEMSRMMNVMAAAAQAGSAELPQIKAALEQCGMASKGANVSFAETNAAIQVLDKAGKKASEGGIALRNVLATLSQGRFLPKDVQQELVAAGVSVESLTPKCWRLNGVKRFITNGDANIKLVLARSEEGTTDGRGLSYFVYDRKKGAVTVRRIENKMGIKGSPTCELVFNNAPCQLVGDRKLGLIKYVMSLMNGARLGVGAQSVGLSEAAYREALKYAQEREQFGKAIIQFPAVYEMLAMMRAKTDAARTILYETSRFVDIYKSYGILQNEGPSLTPEERSDLKLNQRNADMLTPMLKMFASEYANQNAYDAIQIHGGTGFMKDFPVERLYRDARILTIYEGTSQLQVVAAIRHVVNGNYPKLIAEYQAQKLHPDFDHLKNDLQAMLADYLLAVDKVKALESEELLDFHARRLVEMAAYIIMGYLLVIDANRSALFTKSAEIFIQYGKAEVAKNKAFINSFESKRIDLYKA
ncbi:MAG: phage tail tape measure protein, partial [Bacteroidales bacterium]